MDVTVPLVTVSVFQIQSTQPDNKSELNTDSNTNHWWTVYSPGSVVYASTANTQENSQLVKVNLFSNCKVRLKINLSIFNNSFFTIFIIFFTRKCYFFLNIYILIWMLDAYGSNANCYTKPSTFNIVSAIILMVGTVASFFPQVCNISLIFLFNNLNSM